MKPWSLLEQQGSGLCRFCGTYFLAGYNSISLSWCETIPAPGPGVPYTPGLLFWWCSECGDTLFPMANKPLFLQQ